MAPKTKGVDTGPDGAKSGAEERTPADRHAFDADSRAKAREGAPITIGEQVFHRRRKNWEVTRALRALLRVQEREGSRGERLRARISALTTEISGIRDRKTGEWLRPPIDDEDRISTIESQVENLQDNVETASDASDEAAYALIALLLRGDNGEKPDIEHLKKSLDVEEASDLAGMLAGGGEPDPTPETQSSSD